MSKPSSCQPRSQQDSQADILSWTEPSSKSVQQSTPKSVTAVHSRASRPAVPTSRTAKSLSVQGKSGASTQRTTAVSKEPSVKPVQEVPKIVTTASSGTLNRLVPSTRNESIASSHGTADMETRTSMVQSASHRSDLRNDRSSPHTSFTSQSLNPPLSPLIHDDLWQSISNEFPALAEYLKETKLDQKLPEVLSNVFKLKQLPFSPYPQLMCDVRPILER